MEVERGTEYFDYLARLSKYASASRFDDLKYATVQTKLLGMIQEGATALFLVVLRGIAKGQGFPRESNEAIRAGKGGTTKRTIPAACGGARDVKFVPTQTPPLPFFLSTVNGAFFLMLRKKAGLKRSPRLRRGRDVTPFGVTKNAALACGMIFYRSVPTKKIASVPGPECAPMTGPV